MTFHSSWGWSWHKPTPPKNTAPEIITNKSIAVAEGQTFVANVTGLDAEGDALSYSISGGSDGSKFVIDPISGALSFITAPNFEAPTDHGRNNSYDIEVSVRDAAGNVTKKLLQINVDDQVEAGDKPQKNYHPSIKSNDKLAIDENTTFVTTVVAEDRDFDALTFSLDPNDDDGALFQIDPVTGALSFKVAPNFERPTDEHRNNRYEVEVIVRDARGGTDREEIEIEVVNILEAGEPGDRDTRRNNTPDILGGDDYAVYENTAFVVDLAAFDADFDPLTWSIKPGEDGALFQINAATGALSFKIAPDFENPRDANRDNHYQVDVQVSDGKGGVKTDKIHIDVLDVLIEVAPNSAPVIVSGATPVVGENGTAAVTVVANDADGDTLTFSITGGADAELFTIDPATGALVFNDAPDFEAPADAGGDNTYDVVVAVSDGNGGGDDQAIRVTVADLAETGALADAFDADVGAILVINANGGLLANDEVAAGGTLVVTSAGGAAPGVSVAGSDGGTFLIGADGSIRFDPGADFVSLGAGEILNTTIEYQIADGLGTTSTSTATVAVRGVNDAPIFLDSAFDNELDPFNQGPQGGLVALETGSGGSEIVTDVIFVADPDANDTLVFTLTGEDAALFSTTLDPLSEADLADFGIVPPTGFTDFATLRPTQLLNTASLSADGDQLFEFTLTVTDGNGGSIATDYEILIT